MATIELTQGKVTIVDDEDYEYLSRWKWYYTVHGYACRRGRKADGERKGKLIYIHRQILGIVDGTIYVDHINGDMLDNRRINLRECSHRQNMCNRGSNKNNTSGYKGVRWFSRNNKWVAKIEVNGQTLHLGYFTDIKEAAKAYDKAALKYFGEFAFLNTKEKKE